jgi:hypothetical protein
MSLSPFQPNAAIPTGLNHEQAEAFYEMSIAQQLPDLKIFETDYNIFKILFISSKEKDMPMKIWYIH